MVPSRSEMLVAARAPRLGLVCRGYDDKHTLKKIDEAVYDKTNCEAKQSKITDYCIQVKMCYCCNCIP